ncbi:MAG TPA: MarR family transcriptional regulator [Clostridia bacterium]|nr:MarR family transcriptional regulator [Clostridia bacterium]
MKNEFEAFKIAMLIQEIYSSVMHLVGNGLQDSGLTHQQVMIIKLIAHKKEINISELCKEMSLTKGTVSGIVQRLNEAGYVEKIKHQDDKRNTYVVFSEKGKLFAKEFRDTINDSFQRVFANFTLEEMSKTEENLRELNNKLKENK